MNIGYTLLVILLITISLLALHKFNQLKNLTKSIIIHDHLSLDLEKKLIDAILSQVSLERKYFILQDPIFYQRFQAKEGEILAYFDRLHQLSETSKGKALAEKAYRHYLEYLALLKAEVALVQAKKDYPLFLYQQNKEKVIEVINQNLNELINSNQISMSTKLKNSERASDQAGKLIVTIAFLSILLSVVISILITQSINRPLKSLEQATKFIAQGDFNQKVDIYSPPEIGELGRAFTFMCGRLQELDDLKKDFISNISHELRTPLTSIKEASHLLAEGAIGEINQEQKEFLEVIMEEGGKLERHINNLLDLSKMEAGMMSYNQERCDLAQIIRQAIQGLRPVGQKKDIQLELAIRDDSLPIVGDRHRLHQVMTNLLSNAFKFTPPSGRVAISADKVRLNAAMAGPGLRTQDLSSEKGSHSIAGEIHGVIKVSIADTGPGIPEGDWQKVFDKFYQIKQSQPTSPRGTGLGLSIARHILENHGGKIWVESKMGKGSTFTFLLPMRKDDS